MIYEPSADDGQSSRIQSVTALGDEKNFAGFKVVSRIEGHALIQYVLVQPTAESVYEDKDLGIQFLGRYAVISVNDRDECTSFYLGEGSRLVFKGIELASESGNISASAEFTNSPATLTANAPAELKWPDGKHLVSRQP